MNSDLPVAIRSYSIRIFNTAMKLALVFVFDLSFGVFTLLGEKIPQQVEGSVEEGSAMNNDKATINCCRFGSQNSVKREAGSGSSNFLTVNSWILQCLTIVR